MRIDSETNIYRRVFFYSVRLITNCRNPVIRSRRFEGKSIRVASEHPSTEFLSFAILGASRRHSVTVKLEKGRNEEAKVGEARVGKGANRRGNVKCL
jgi:hypothetical protein